ncbi:MAG: SDR family NAD(P)-dependent oxidoreductase [Pelomonas sp.]|nr:SDR family NAD(P)-dependent oxidoreductase [Roseateles sp.]
MADAAPRTVLVTGCSSGIGAALAREFHARGCAVIATARRLESLEPLRALGLRTLALDVCDAASIAALVATLGDAPLDLLVNNAGYGQFGAITDQDLAALRAQFDTNVFAPVVLTNALLPALRRGRDPCVAHVGSISGLVTTPFSGAYAASKAALHAVADAMRMELASLGVRVVTVQPGGIASNFGTAGGDHIGLPDASPFQPLAALIRRRAQFSQVDATPADAFARTAVTHLLDPAAGPICRTGSKSFVLPALGRWLPTRTLDRMLRRRFGLDRFKA